MLPSEPNTIFDVDLDKVDSAAYPALLLSGLVKGTGDLSKFVRESTEAVDLFVGRYLVFLATSYVLIKFVHYKIFPDFPF